jgi:Na+/proline symporter
MAPLLDVDHLIVYVFLLATLAVGMWAGRGIKDIREYAVGNRMYGISVLVFTYLATNLSGTVLLNNSGLVFSDGIIPIFAFFGFCISEMTCALFVAHKIIRFRTCYTMGDLMETLYGKYSGIITGVLGVLQAVTLTGMELVALGITCESLLGIKAVWGIVVGGLILAAYSAHGGIKSVVTTDVMQFLTLIVSVPIIAYMAVTHAGGIHAVFAQVPVEKLSVISHEKFYFYLACFISWGIFPSGLIDPAIIQRMLMGRSAKELRNQFFITAVVNPSVNIIIMLIGLAGLLIYPHIKANDVVPRIINDILPIGIKGFTIAGLIALIMSTADSYLHIAGLSLVHDVIRPLYGSRKKAFIEKEYQWAQKATLLLGIGAIVIGLRATSMFELFLNALALTGPLLMFPLLSGVMGLKPSQRAFYIAAVITILVWIAVAMWLPKPYKHLSLPISIIANGIAFFGAHYILNTGFKVLKSSQDGESICHWPEQPLSRSTFSTYIPTLKNIARYSRGRVEKYGAPYILAGIFCCFNLIAPYFLWQSPNDYEDGLLNVRFVGATLCGLLIIKDKWTQGFHLYMPFFFHFTLLYCLPFSSTVMLLATQGDMAWLINLALSILMLMVLVDYLSVVLLSALGILVGLLFYTYFWTPTIHLSFTVISSSLILYQCTVGVFIILLFARRRQRSFDALVTQREQLVQDNQESQKELFSTTEAQMRFINILKKAGIEKLGNVAHLSKQLLERSRQEGSKGDLTKLAQQLTDQLTPMALHMDRFVHRTTGFLLLDRVEELLLENFLQIVQQALHTKKYKPKIAVHTLQKQLQCDVEKMKKVMLNGFDFMHLVAEKEVPWLLAIEDTQLGYPVDSVSPDHVKKVNALRFVITTASTSPKLETRYMAQIGEVITKNPEASTDMPLLANERIVKAHYGYSSTISREGALTLIYVIPVNLREVRSKDMDSPQMNLGAEWPRADDTYPGAQEQEQAFLQAVRERSSADLALVKKAINLIKDYHGPIMRKSGEPFYLHPIAVAQIVLDYNTEEATVLGALLHDTVEDTSLTLEQIELLFNKEVRDVVNGVTHMESHKETLYKVQLSHPENIHRLSGAEDKRVLYVKLADRLHNMRTIQEKPYESQRRTSEETLLFFVSLAKYLGLSEAAEELRNMSFDILGK